jgi:hypothetical protein
MTSNAASVVEAGGAMPQRGTNDLLRAIGSSASSPS